MDDIVTRVMCGFATAYAMGTLYFAYRTGRIPYGRGRAGVLYAERATNPRTYWLMIVITLAVLVYSVPIIAFGPQHHHPPRLNI